MNGCSRELVVYDAYGCQLLCGDGAFCPSCASKMEARVRELEAALREEQDETARLLADRRACLDCEHASVTDKERLKELKAENASLRPYIGRCVDCEHREAEVLLSVRLQELEGERDEWKRKAEALEAGKTVWESRHD